MEPAGSVWRDRLRLAAVGQALASAEADAAALEAQWRRDRLERWHACCDQDLVGGGRRIYRWVWGGVDAPQRQANWHLPGTMESVADLSSGCQVMRWGPWEGDLGPRRQQPACCAETSPGVVAPQARILSREAQSRRMRCAS